MLRQVIVILFTAAIVAALSFWWYFEKSNRISRHDYIVEKCNESFLLNKKRLNIALEKEIRDLGLTGDAYAMGVIEEQAVGTSARTGQIAIGCDITVANTTSVELKLRMASTLNSDGEVYHTEFVISHE